MINKRYIVSKKLGEGRSKVFNVIDTEFPDREVAAKFLSPSASSEEKEFFREEFFVLQKLDHPNIIKSFELSCVLIKDEDEDIEIEKFSSFITMEYFSPIPILNYAGLKEEKKLNQIIKQICSVLYYLHQSNYIYYDLKAENILVSELNGNPIIKIIDLGFARNVSSGYEKNIQGTAHYIAPELLKNEQHNFTVDFYSLGMLLYRIVYGKFPFSSDVELDIYKAHIEEEFVLGPSIYSKKLTNVISKLIKKNPEDRYKNALQIILDLQLPIDFEVVKDLVPAKVFSDRKDAFNILSTYLKDKTSNEAFIVTGFDGSGKTSLLLEIFRQKQFSVYIENTKIKTGLEAVKYIFRKIILTETVYNERQQEYSEIINDVFDKSSKSFFESVKRIFNTLPSGGNLTILIDDYNLYDEFTKESLAEMIRIFQVKGIKIILTESSDFDHSSTTLNNRCDIQLNQFTDHQLSEFLDLSYSPLFPKQELKKYILLYSDLQPGSIKQFIKDLILLKVIKFNNAEVVFESSEDVILALQSSHEELYRMRLSNLNNAELKLAQIISAFEISVEQTVLAALLDVSHEKLKSILNELEKKNIIDSLSLSNAPRINSFNFNKYIYSTINNRIKFHIVLANSIKKLFADFNIMELARQFELANEYEQSVEFLKKEILQAEEINAFAYKRSLLEKALGFDLIQRTFAELTFELVKTLYKLSDYKLVIENLYKQKLERYSELEKNELLFIKGSSLIELRKTEEGKNILTQLKSDLKNKILVRRILVELAYAEYDLNNYETSEEYCKNLLNDKEVTLEDQGRVLNLLSMIELQVKGNPKTSLQYSLEALNKYELAQLPRRVAGTHVNIGTIYDIQGDRIGAEKHWQRALAINSAIGNLEQEGIILLNYGVFHHNHNKFENSIESWQKANKIFNSIGMQNNFAVAVGNMGEVYLQICDYQNSYENLCRAGEIFAQLNNREEELNILFLQGKFWFILGGKDQLKKIIERYEYYSLTLETLSEKLRLNLDFLRLLIIFMESKGFEDKKAVMALVEKANKEGENLIATEIIFLLIEDLTEKKKFTEAIELLNDIDLVNYIQENIIFRVQREYLLGKIAFHTQYENLKSPIEYFEQAYSLLEEESIYELTWKILFTIAETYWERGNFHKAKKPRHYAYELINMIGENITDNKLRSTYFNHPERKKALEKLVLIGNQTQLNEYQKS